MGKLQPPCCVDRSPALHLTSDSDNSNYRRTLQRLRKDLENGFYSKDSCISIKANPDTRGSASTS